MAAWYHPHVAVGWGAVRESDPRGEDVGLGKTPVRGVLVPGHEAGASRLLGEERGVPAEEIRPQHVLDRVEDGGVADEIREPREEQMRLDPIDAAQGSPEVPLGALQP